MTQNKPLTLTAVPILRFEKAILQNEKPILRFEKAVL